MKLLGTSKNNKPEAGGVPLLETSAPSKQGGGGLFARIKLIIIGIIALALVLLVITLIIHITRKEGKKTAENLAEYLGVNIATAEDKLEMHMKDNSAYAIINKSDSFDYILESEDEVNIDDIRFPEWTVTAFKTGSEKLETVVFSDYRVLKSDSRGTKLDKRPDLDSYGRNTKISTVLDAIECEPFRITYDLGFTRYEFRYCFEQDNGDIQSVILTVTADLEGRFFYSTSQDLDPFFIASKIPTARSTQ
ncbi:MAG: hypothetical protein IKN17_11100 [Ruminococcus sp.]|nr:hypothetical protein [Ruminococcus sp.]